jgi:hypothetical protein
MANLTDPIVGAGDANFRLLDTLYTPDADHTTWISHTVELHVTAPLLSSQTIEVDLMLSPPGGDEVAFASGKLSSTQGGGLSLLSLGTTIQVTLSAFVPPAWTWALRTSGAGTATYISGQEAKF